MICAKATNVGHDTKKSILKQVILTFRNIIGIFERVCGGFER